MAIAGIYNGKQKQKTDEALSGGWWGDDGDDSWWDGNPDASSRKAAKRITKPSDLELYESRANYWFASETPLCDDLPRAESPEGQVAAASAWDFFRLVRFH